MKILYFDCFSGISGDMTLGALLDLGIDKDLFLKELSKLNLTGYEIVIGTKSKSGITCTDVNVIITEDYKKLEEKFEKHQKEMYEHELAHKAHTHVHIDEHGHEYSHDHEDSVHNHEHNHDDNHSHHHDHGHEHEHSHGHTHTHDHSHPHSHSHSMRNLKTIEMMIEWSDLSQNVKDLSKRIFREIAEAEAKVHNMEVENVTFHEVGAIDSIVDIVGTAICLDALGVKKVYSSPLHDGKGFIECQHGTIPVPVPAVMEMLAGSGIPLISEDVQTEMVTPTGMGIIKTIACSFGNIPELSIEKVGYGAGKRDTGRFNALRVVLGSLDDKNEINDEIIKLETNIDDISSEILGYTMERLFGVGALDVFLTPIYMKKNRPATMITVLVNRENEQAAVDLLLKETTTLGIRKSSLKRYCLDREIMKINTQFGEVRVKVSKGKDFSKLSPEYDDCRKIAETTGLPLREIYQIVNESSKDLL